MHTMGQTAADVPLLFGSSIHVYQLVSSSIKQPRVQLRKHSQRARSASILQATLGRATGHFDSGSFGRNTLLYTLGVIQALYWGILKGTLTRAHIYFLGYYSLMVAELSL